MKSGLLPALAGLTAATCLAQGDATGLALALQAVALLGAAAAVLLAARGDDISDMAAVGLPALLALVLAGIPAAGRAAPSLTISLQAVAWLGLTVIAAFTLVLTLRGLIGRGPAGALGLALLAALFGFPFWGSALLEALPGELRPAAFGWSLEVCPLFAVAGGLFRIDVLRAEVLYRLFPMGQAMPYAWPEPAGVLALNACVAGAFTVTAAATAPLRRAP